MASSRRRGSTKERSLGHWSYIVTLPKRPDEKKPRQDWVSGFTSGDDAERALTKRLAELDQGIGDNPSSDTLAVYLAEWLESKQIRGNSYINYEAAIRLWIVPALGDVKLGQLRPE